jgi:hypothetical protein
MQDWLDQLHADGCIGGTLTLTESGRCRALAFLGTDALPAKMTWTTLIPKYLVPRALGVELSNGPAVKRLSREDGLAGVLLKRQFGIMETSKESLDSVLEAIVCKTLGYEAASLKDLKQQVMARLLDAKDGTIPKQAKHQARALLKANNLGQLRSKAFAVWVAAGDDRVQPGAEATCVDSFDLHEFARTVLAAAGGCPTGWFGNNKVFINHVYRHLQGEPAFRDMSLDDFKQRLVQANQNAWLELSRADLVAVMDANDVRESETFQRGATYHFLFVNKEPP